MQRRIKINADAPPSVIYGKEGEVLGTFIPGLGYWVTPQNKKSVERVLAEGHATEVDPATAPRLPADLKGLSGQVGGFLKVGDH